MDLLQAMRERHSVRTYTPQPIEGEVLQNLKQYIDQCNQESGLHIQLILNEPQAFSGRMAHYGKFSGVRNYIALVGNKGANLDEKLGYYGEKIVLMAQTLGLNTCWVALTYSKSKAAYTLDKNEKCVLVIAIGYGATAGTAHRGKTAEQVMRTAENPPQWFQNGINAALLTPTAMNQQKFTFSLDGKKVTAKAGTGFYTKVDLGIAKAHFELGAGKENFTWG